MPASVAYSHPQPSLKLGREAKCTWSWYIQFCWVMDPSPDFPSPTSSFPSTPAPCCTPGEAPVAGIIPIQPHAGGGHMSCGKASRLGNQANIHTWYLSIKGRFRLRRAGSDLNIHNSHLSFYALLMVQGLLLSGKSRCMMSLLLCRWTFSCSQGKALMLPDSSTRAGHEKGLKEWAKIYILTYNYCKSEEHVTQIASHPIPHCRSGFSKNNGVGVLPRTSGP